MRNERLLDQIQLSNFSHFRIARSKLSQFTFRSLTRLDCRNFSTSTITDQKTIDPICSSENLAVMEAMGKTPETFSC